MQNYVVVTVPQDLLPDVVGELLRFAADPNDVDVVHGEIGREIHVHPAIADAWIEYRRTVDGPEAPAPEPAPETKPEPPEPAPVLQEPAPVKEVVAPAPVPTATVILAPAPAPPTKRTTTTSA